MTNPPPADRTLTIASRFCGPPGSGNGGYVAGLVASLLSGPVEVTLKAPSPLDTPLRLRAHEGGAQLLHGDAVIATGRPGSVDMAPPPAPTLAAAEAASARYAGFTAHLYPDCFVCGVKRRPGDGLRVFAGPAGEDGIVAALWTPEAHDADADGRALSEIVWAALDCPSYFALKNPALAALLGRITAELSERPKSGEPCIVVGWRLGQERRRHISASALYSADGRLLAKAKAIWIELAKPA